MKRILLFIFLFPFAISPSAKKNYIVNFGGNSDCPVKGWSNNGKYEEIFRWGRGKNLFLEGDISPVSDGTASFVSKSGSSIELAGLEQHVRYVLWIDFVRFKDMDKSGLSSRLEIYADRSKIADLDITKLPLGKYVGIDIPDDVTFKGSCLITFREYSLNPGMWGAWDIIIAEESFFPDAAEIDAGKNPPPVKEIKSGIQQKKNTFKKEVKKNIPSAEVKKKEDKPADAPRQDDSIKKSVNESVKKDLPRETGTKEKVFDVLEPVPPREPSVPDIVE
ncbi:MAG: hypothetical protein KA015_00075 [Spirochaetes bacterium]|nr:hypothetical protein [Spirochaetota bacterium]